jgi:hypothetical protein
MCPSRGDVEGEREAIQSFADHADEVVAMGKRPGRSSVRGRTTPERGNT